jgi:integration host factor subunit beta
VNKNRMAKQLSRQFGFTQRESQILVDHILNALAGELVKGRRAELRGLGTFGTRRRKASVGRVVKTGKSVAVPALRRVYFRPGRELKEISREADKSA